MSVALRLYLSIVYAHQRYLLSAHTACSNKSTYLFFSMVSIRVCVAGQYGSFLSLVED
jgi:hypothetical protein